MMGICYKALDRQIGANLREAREAANIAIDDLAAAMDCAASHVQRFEAGDSRISAMQLHMASRRLGVEITTLFDGVSGPSEAGHPSAPMRSENVSTLMATVRERSNLNALIESIPTPLPGTTNPLKAA